MNQTQLILLLPIESMKKYVNAVQSLPSDQMRVINKQLEQECYKLQAKVNKLINTELRKYKGMDDQIFDLARNIMVQQGMDYQTANGFIQLAKKLADDTTGRRMNKKTTNHNNSSAPMKLSLVAFLLTLFHAYIVV